MGFLSGLMGGGGGGGGDQMPPPEMQPVPQISLQTEGWPGMGYTPVPQTFTPEAMPYWMQANNAPQQQGYIQGQPNWFAAPWWGKDAVTGQNLTQEMLQPQLPPPPSAPAEGGGGGEGGHFAPGYGGFGARWVGGEHGNWEANVGAHDRQRIRSQIRPNSDAGKRLADYYKKIGWRNFRDR